MPSSSRSGSSAATDAARWETGKEVFAVRQSRETATNFLTITKRMRRTNPGAARGGEARQSSKSHRPGGAGAQHGAQRTRHGRTAERAPRRRSGSAQHQIFRESHTAGAPRVS